MHRACYLRSDSQKRVGVSDRRAHVSAGRWQEVALLQRRYTQIYPVVWDDERMLAMLETPGHAGVLDIVI